jgi:dTMP kinase
VYAAGAPEALLNTVNALVTGETRPDITFILDLSPEDAYFRRMNRDGQSAYDPAESTRDFQRVRQGFQVRAQAEPWRCKLIDAHRDEASVADTILTELRGAGLLPA